MREFFIDTFYENASPLRWEQSEDDAVDLFLMPDHERFSPNRQVTHWNFRIEAPPERVGQRVRLRFRAVSGCWSGQPNMNFVGGRMMSAVSGNGRDWEIVARLGRLPGAGGDDALYLPHGYAGRSVDRQVLGRDDAAGGTVRAGDTSRAEPTAEGDCSKRTLVQG